jgi:hypothetical protein
LGARSGNDLFMPMSHDRCSFEVVYKKNAEGLDVVEHVVVRTGLSDASVTLTIPQVYNLARLLNIVQQVSERSTTESNGSLQKGSSPTVQTMPRAQVIRSE